jgi:hypothetical protein
MSPYKWEKEYEKTGMAAFKESHVAVLRGAQNKYANDYVVFFRTLATMLGPDTDLGSMAFKTFEASQAVTRVLGVMLGVQGRPASEIELRSLEENMKFIESVIGLLDKHADDNPALADSMRKAEVKTKVSFSRLKIDHKTIREGLDKMKLAEGGDISGFLKKNAPDLYRASKGMGIAAIQAALGPFAGVAGIVGGGISGIVRGMRDKAVAGKQAKLAGALTSRFEDTSSIMKRYDTLVKKGTPMSELAKPGSLNRGFQDMSSKKTAGVATNKTKMPFADALGSILGKTSRDGVSPVQQTNLYEFFDKGAFRARWTRELYDMIKKGGGAGGKESVGLGGIMDTGKKLAAGGILASAGALFGKALPWAGVGLALWDGIRNMGKAKDIFGVPAGKKASVQENISAFVGGTVGGGKGIFDEGTVGEKIQNIIIKSLEGAMVGKFVGLPGMITGAIAGAITGAVGGENMTRATKAVIDTLSPNTPKTAADIVGMANGMPGMGITGPLRTMLLDKAKKEVGTATAAADQAQTMRSRTRMDAAMTSTKVDDLAKALADMVAKQNTGSTNTQGGEP